MKATAMMLGLTGSILVLIYAVRMAFFGQDMFPGAVSASRFNPDAFVVFIAGVLGIFGGLLGTAGSILCLWDSGLSGIMLLGAAVAGAVMFGALIALFWITKIYSNEYIVVIAGVITFLLLAVSGVLALKSSRSQKNSIAGENS